MSADAAEPGRSGGFFVDGVRLEAARAEPGLHVVATPIGNLGDISLRALRTLAGVDLVAAEDTRHSGRLLAHYGIEARFVRYDEHGGAAARPRLLAHLAAGGSAALISDAGTPLVSDPGFRLVAEARAAGVRVHAVPGACAPVAALSVAGLPTDAFLFAGFLPAKAAARRARLAELATVPATLAFFEAPHRLAEALADVAAVLPGRTAAVARELTKRFEEVVAAPVEALAAAPPEARGEIVLLLGPPGPPAAADAEDVDALLVAALHAMPVSAAAADVARATGLDRRTLYRRALALKGR